MSKPNIEVISPDLWQPVINTPMALGESPLWVHEESALYWIDITGRAIHRFDPESSSHKNWCLPSEPGCIAPCKGGGLIVAMRNGLAHFNTAKGMLTPIANAPYDSSKIRFNDGRCDAAGRLWAGTLYEPRDKEGATLFCVERGQLKDMKLPATVSNGIAFSTDHRTLYRTDTTSHKIMAYDFQLASGEIGNGKLFQQFSRDKSKEYGGRPDGATVDSENNYWCAMYEGGKILRFSPMGELLQEFRLPVRYPTMLAFGGKDLHTLYVTSARQHLSAEELKSHPLSGYVLTLKTETCGRIEPNYIR